MGSKNPQVEFIRENGDVFDADSRLRKLIGARAVVGSSLAIGMVPGLAYPNMSDAESGFYSSIPITGPAYGAGVALTAAAIYAAHRFATGDRPAKAAENARELRSVTPEPIDVFRYKTFTDTRWRRTHVTEMRWYGADETWNDDGSDTKSLTRRLRTMADLADEHDIDMLSLGTAWVKERDVDLSEYGSLSPGKPYFSSRKELRIVLQDDRVDDMVLATTSEQARQLADDLDALVPNDQAETIGELVAQLKDPQLGRHYKRYKEKPTERTAAMLMAHAKSLLEQSIGSERHTAIRTTEHGTVDMRRVTTDHRVRGKHVVSHSSWLGQTGAQGIELGDGSELLARFGAPSMDALLSTLRGKKLVTSDMQDKAVGAVYLLALDAVEKQQQEARAVAKLRGSFPKTTLELHEETTLMHVPKLRAKASPEATAHLNYDHKKPAIVRTLAIGSFAIALFLHGANLAGGNIGEAVEQRAASASASADAALKSREQQAYENRDPEQERALWQAAYEHDLGIMKPLVDGVDTVKEFDKTLYESIAGTYVNLFGQDFLDAITPDQRIISDGLQRRPGSAAALPEMRIGDSPQNGNEHAEHYSIASLTAKPTEGYWYSRVMNQMSVLTPVEPLGLSIGYGNYADHPRQNPSVATILGIPSVREVILEDKPDYEVSTRFVGEAEDGHLSLPIPENGSIIGAYIVDTNDPRRTVPVSVSYGPTTGEYVAYLNKTPQQDLTAHGIEAPLLKYFVKTESRKTVTQMFDPMVLGHVDMDRVAAETKHALGLPADASDGDVYDAIKRKTYSFTPFADGRASIPEERLTGTITEDVTEIAKVLAHLESLNCNLASTLMLLGTASNGTMPYQQAMGYREDGNGTLEQGEAHAWLIDQNDEIVDPTPAGSQSTSIDARSGASLTSSDMQRWGGILVGAATLIVAYRRRAKIAGSIAGARADYVLEHPATADAVTQISAATYGTSMTNAPLYTMPDHAVAASIPTLPLNVPASVIVEKRKAQGEELSGKQRRAIKRVLRHGRFVGKRPR